MRKISIITAIVMALSLTTASVALADGPTCSDVEALNVEVHGQHVIRDYVTQGEPGARGGPAHFDHGPEVGPGASFCLAQAQAQSPSGPPNR